MIDIKQLDDDIDLSTADITYSNNYDATEQHKADILVGSQGDYAAAPLIGVGLVEYLGDQNNGDMLRQITVMMRRDGIDIKRVAFDANGELIIDGSYENDNNRG